MKQEISSHRKKHFEKNSLVWAALHHLLPTSLIRELSYVIVDQISNGTLSLHMLFDEKFIGEGEFSDMWLLRPVETHSQLAEYLQFRIRAFTWQSDAEIISPPEPYNKASVSPADLEKIIDFGIADFHVSDFNLSDCQVSSQASVKSFVDAFLGARESLALSTEDKNWTNLIVSIHSIETPLSAVVAKHLGDLCADADVWDKADALYSHADKILSENTEIDWKELRSSMHAIISQSRAAAARTLNGVDQADRLLANIIKNATLQADSLLIANTSFDAMVAATQSALNKGDVAPDRRPILLFPPLLHKTHCISSALKYLYAGNFNDANRNFWAVLRRQIALGSATESRATKAFYGRSILEEVFLGSARQSLPRSIQTALRLLIESGDSKTINKIGWNHTFIDTYVDQQCVEMVIAHTGVHLGSKLERQLVSVELFKEWLERISIDRTDVAKSMLIYLAKLALQSDVSFYEEKNLGGRCLKALQYVGQFRPELRFTAASDIANAVLEKIRAPGFWTGSASAIETALAYADVFNKDNLNAIVESVLLLIDEIGPSTGNWPITRSALNLLISAPVKNLSGNNHNLGRRIIATILRCGLEQESERARVLFYLHDFDPELLREDSVKNSLQDTVVYIRHKANKINASNVVDYIQALFVAPAVSGSDGVRDGLEGLTCLLRSVTAGKPSHSLPFAYAPLLLLADRQKQIADDISIKLATFQTWLQPLIDLIVNLWIKVIERPTILAPFSLPPSTKPDSTVVHNWAFSSILFAGSLGQREKIQNVLTSAAAHPLLTNAITLAKATRSLSCKDENVDVNAIRIENRETFYSALGRRLVLLQKLDDESAREVCKALIDQCILQGPRELDAAVFLSAFSLNLREYLSQTSCSDYKKRLDNNRDFRLTILPILDMA